MCSCSIRTNHDRRTCDCPCHGDRDAVKADAFDYLADFRSRLVRAEQALRDLAQSDPSESMRSRLHGKAEGVSLALSYFDEIQRLQS